MPKKRSDGAPATEVAAFLVPKYLCACPVGVTTAVQTAYAGSVDVTNEKKGTVYKCLHCPAQFCGDPRRMQRHYLPVVEPGFWGKGEARGVCACTNSPPSVVARLTEMGCSEFVKYKAQGDQYESKPKHLVSRLRNQKSDACRNRCLGGRFTT